MKKAAGACFFFPIFANFVICGSYQRTAKFEDPEVLQMLKCMLFIAAALPATASAADYINGKSNYVERRICHSEQSGGVYCVDAPPIEKLTTDCDAGVDCHHMESGQHYSLQRPLNAN